MKNKPFEKKPMINTSDLDYQKMQSFLKAIESYNQNKGFKSYVKKVPEYLATTDSLMKNVSSIGSHLNGLKDFFETRRKKRNIKNMKDFAAAAAVAALPVLFSDSLFKEKEAFEKKAARIDYRGIQDIIENSVSKELKKNNELISRLILQGNQISPQMAIQGQPKGSGIGQFAGGALVGSLASALLMGGGPSFLAKKLRGVQESPLEKLFKPQNILGGGAGFLLANKLKKDNLKKEEPPYKV